MNAGTEIGYMVYRAVLTSVLVFAIYQGWVGLSMAAASVLVNHVVSEINRVENTVNQRARF